MLWGDKQIGDFNKNFKEGVHKHVMGFNEYVHPPFVQLQKLIYNLQA